MYNKKLATILGIGAIALSISIPQSAHAETPFWKENLTGIPTNDICYLTAERECITTPPNSYDPQDVPIDPEYSTKDSIDRLTIDVEVI